MTIEAWVMLTILIVMFGLLIWNKLPAWIVFVGALAVTMTLRLAPEGDLLKGFANPSVATVGVLFTVAAGMYSTGAISIISDKLIGLPHSLNSAQVKILPPVAAASAFLNNTPLVAMMIPVVKDIGQSARLAVSKLLIPLSFASILGGATTMIGTSTNLVIAGLVSGAIAAGSLEGMRPINIFDPTLIGLPAAVVGIVFIIFVGVRLLPQPEEVGSTIDEKRLYRAEFIALAGSPLVGKTVRDAGLAQAEGYQLISLERDEDQQVEAVELKTEPAMKTMGRLFHRFKWLNRRWAKRTPPKKPVNVTEAKALEEQILQAGDILVFHTVNDAVPELWTKIGLKPAVGINLESKRHEHRLVEVVVAPQHPAVGRQVSDLPVREDPPYIAEIVATSRNGRPIETSISDMRIEAGDNAILEVEDSFFYEVRTELEFSLIHRLRGYRVQRTDRAVVATIITIAMVLLTALGVMSMLNAGLLAFLALWLTGCLNLKRAWRSIEWDTLVVLGVAIGLESAITSTGLSQVLAELLGVLGGSSPMAALAIVFVGAVIMTNVIASSAAAAFMFPVALSIANSMGLNFMPFAMILMMGTSYAFINPAGYQTNLMVQGPGNYNFTDFVKIGVPLTILAGIVVLLLAPIVYGF